jgi:hypothetical protein
MWKRYGWMIVLCLGLWAPNAFAQQERVSMFSRPVQRDGFHFQMMFGGGAGPGSLGLWHNMEVGTTLSGSGITLGYTHIFLLSESSFRALGHSDMFGGHMFLVKVPVGFPDLVAKAAIGLGETVELHNGFVPYFGFGWHVGLDWHLPMNKYSGFTLSASMVHAITPRHGSQLGFGISLGYTWF